MATVLVYTLVSVLTVLFAAIAIAPLFVEEVPE